MIPNCVKVSASSKRIYRVTYSHSMNFQLLLRNFTVVLFALVGLSSALAQSQNSTSHQSLRPDAIVTVSEDKSTAELVEITMVDANYSKKVLEQIVSNFGFFTSVAPRGIMIYDDKISESQSFIKAKFGINGLIEPGMSEFRLEQIVKSFTGLPELSRVRNIQIIFPDQQPGPLVIQFHSNQFCDVQGTFQSSPLSLEYFVRLRTQVPSEVSIPPKVLAKKIVEKKNEQKGDSSRLLLYGLVGIAAVGAGIFAYLMFAKGNSQA